MNDSAITYTSFTASVLSRPRMYTLDGSFAEVIAYIQGYFGGASKGKPDWEPAIEWALFEQWVAGQLNVPLNGLYGAFIKLHGEDALPELKRLYAKYRL